MIARQARVDTGMGVSCIASTVFHLAVFLLLVWWGRLFPLNMKLQETYYVDVVNLPVASPQSGSPNHKENSAKQSSASRKTTDSAMLLPKPDTKPQNAKLLKTPVKVKDSTSESSEEFTQRMSKLEKVAEARQEESVLARLREKVSNQGSGRAGMPAGSGNEAGSDYLAYLQSRLKDAFRETISYTSKNPEMTVRLFIDTAGKLSRRKAERSSGDRAFEISVFRAIDKASEKFTPPPGRKSFEGVFVFKREGITQNKK
jgi:colicin import membrane protein